MASEHGSSLLSLEDICSADEYEHRRETLRSQALATRKLYRIAIGPNLTLLFENRLTILYQIMEMLRIEKKWTSADITEELEAYNPLISASGQLKATLLVEYEDEDVRRSQLKLLRGLEHNMWSGVADEAKSYAVADEDMPRSNTEKTSAVHFLRYPIEPLQRQRLAEGSPWVFGCDHPQYRYDSGPILPTLQEALLVDLAKPL